MEQEGAVDARVTGLRRAEREGGNVVGRDAHHAVRVDELTLVPDPLLLVEIGEGGPLRRPAERERRRSLSVRNPVLPVELAAARLAERGNDLAELGVHRPAVVALVEVLDDAFPVRLDLVGDPPARAELRERVVREVLGDLAELHREVPLRRLARSYTREVHDDEASPRFHIDGVACKLLLAQPVGLVEERRVAELSRETVGPRVVRADDRALEAPPGAREA